jgi:hypothetical protein
MARQNKSAAKNVVIDEPETTLRFGGGDGNAPKPPKGPCKMFVFPHSRRVGWINKKLAIASRLMRSGKMTRTEVVNFLDDAVQSRIDEMTQWGFKQPQMDRDLLPVCDVFNEWIKREWPKSE